MIKSNQYIIDDGVPFKNSPQGMQEVELHFDATQFQSLGVEAPIPITLVNIKDIPTDWVGLITIALVTLFAAFWGSFSAFFLNWLHQYKQERDKYHEIINKTILSLTLNINRIVSFKRYFLFDFKEEFSLLKEYTSRYPAAAPVAVVAALHSEWINRVRPILFKLNSEDERLGGLLLKWDEVEFTTVKREELSFLMSYLPDTMRILEQAEEEIRSFQRSMRLRNETWYKRESILKEGRLFDIIPNSDILLCVYELIDHRDNIAENLDFYIALATDAIKKITLYRRMHFPEETRCRAFCRFLRSNFQTRKWIKMNFPDGAIQMFPSADKYRAFIEPHTLEELRQKRLAQRKKNRK